VRRESRRVSVGASVRSGFFGARAAVSFVCAGTKVLAWRFLRKQGLRWRQAEAIGGFQCAVRVTRDPNRIHWHRRAGVGRKLRVGETTLVVSGGSYFRRRGSELVSDSRSRQG
jgi:hypothetical protein